MNQGAFKRGTLVVYRYAGGKVVHGKILGAYSSEMPGWYRVELTDECGKYGGACHQSQLLVRRA